MDQIFTAQKNNGNENNATQLTFLEHLPVNVHNNIISIDNHTHSHPIREIIVLAIVKIGRGEAESNFYYCVYNYSLIGRECV